jgi:cell division ATPase FtsA
VRTGRNDITNDIALGLAVSLDEAERLKLELNPALPMKRKLDEIIEARLSDIFELIENHLKKIKRNGLLPAGIIIVGAGSHVDNIEQLARQTLKLPAKLFDPTSHNHLKTQIRDAAWVVAYGLCLYGLDNAKPGPAFTLPGLQQAKKRFSSWLQELLP